LLKSSPNEVEINQERKGCSSNSKVPPSRSDSSNQLMKLREQLSIQGLDAFLVPSSDAHQSKYVAEQDKRRAWLSGFTGSDGFAVVTESSAALWTDGRYYLQADEQLDCNWILMRSEEPETPDWWDWLQKEANVEENECNYIIGADPSLAAAEKWIEWEEKLRRRNMRLKPILTNPIDRIWKTRPLGRATKLNVQSLKYTGRPWLQKVEDLRKDLHALGATAMVVTALDEIAWLLNIRGDDIPHTPVVKSYAFVSQNAIYFWLPRLPPVSIQKHLRVTECLVPKENCVVLRKYKNILKELPAVVENTLDGKVLLSKPWAYTGGASFAIYDALEVSRRLLEYSPIMFRKAQKNKVEIRGMENANLKDAVALIAFAAEIEKGMSLGEHWHELKVSKRILDYRSEQDLFKGSSFKTIAAYGENGAVIHYIPTNKTNTKIGTQSFLLLDSGGQYLDGTTDVTRTFHYGQPTPFEKEAYTRVLMGSIDLAKGVFRAGTTDSRMDILARMPLYEVGLNYRHGTGHGIGSFGLIHESTTQVRIYQKEEHELKVGMFFSDEPGVYFAESFGIRLETVLRVVEKNLTYSEKGFGPFYGFKPVLLVPFEPKLIDVNLLSVKQLEWLNSYNCEIKEKVGPLLLSKGYMAGYQWMMKRVGGCKGK